MKSEPTGHFNRLEIFWTVTPTIFIGFLFHAGYSSYIRNATAADGATEIRVRAKKWSWEFEYPSGDRAPGELTLEVGSSVQDDPVLGRRPALVLHPGVPAEARRGARPVLVHGSRRTIDRRRARVLRRVLRHEPLGHARDVKIVSQKEFDDYMKEGPPNPDCLDPKAACPEPLRAKWGEKLFVQNGCPTCHARDGSTKSPGPNLKGKYGTMEKMMGGIPDTMVEENYIKESIRKPQSKMVMGYPGVVMPTFTLSDRQVDALIAYIKSLK